MTARVPRQTTGFADPAVSEFARDTIAAFKTIRDTIYMDVDVVFSTAAFTFVPKLPDGSQLVDSPKEVRCHRARIFGNSITHINPGGMSWDWVNSAVKVYSVAGLTIGTRYTLGFAVVA